MSGAVPHSIPVGPADRRPQNPVSALRRDRFSERGHVATLRRKAGVVSTRWGDSFTEGFPPYLAPVVIANTKYSINNPFTQKMKFAGKGPKRAKNPKHPLAHETSRSARTRGKSGKFRPAPEPCRPRPQQERMSHKRRLGFTRQGFVFGRNVTPTSCVPGMWIAGRNCAGFERTAHAGAHRPRGGSSSHPACRRARGGDSVVVRRRRSGRRRPVPR